MRRQPDARPDDEPSALDEYREVLADHRHYEVLRWTVVGLTYPSAFAAIWFAGNRWGFTSGRAYLVLVLSTLWLVGGSLVFAQMHFYDRVRVWRARELEAKFTPPFQNVSNRCFGKPPDLKQPWYTQGLAIWFYCCIPVGALVGCLVYGIALFRRWVPFGEADRDTLALNVGNVVLIGTVAIFVVLAVCRTDLKKCRRCADRSPKDTG
jgi:hypothetical protein